MRLLYVEKCGLFSLVFAAILLLLLGASLTAVVVGVCETLKGKIAVGLIFGFIFSVILVVGVVTSIPAKYKVILNPDYPMSDLYAKYKVVDQEGEIWTLQEKKGISIYDDDIYMYEDDE